MDNFLLQAIVDETAPKLLGQRLRKVYQPSSTDLVLTFKSGPANSLLISTDPDRLSLYLGHRSMSETSDKQSDLPGFAARLRKSLGSSRLVGIEKLGDDRVIFLDFGGADDVGRSATRRLAISLAGRSADTYLIENQTIVASLKNRNIGETYHPPSPAADRLDPFLLPDAVWLDLIAESSGNVGAAAARLLGFTRTLTRELEFLSGAVGPIVALRDLLARLSEDPPEPAIYSKVGLESLALEPGQPEAEMFLTYIKLQHLEDVVVTRFQSLSEAAERYFALLASRRVVTEKRQELTSQLKSQLRKQASLREKLTRELSQCGNADAHQRFGDLLLANLHQIARSGDEFVVTDYFAPGEPTIGVPDKQTADPRVAAEHYFKLARKARNGIAAIKKRLPGVDATVGQLEESLDQLSRASSLDALARIQSGVRLPAQQKGRVRKKGEEVRERFPGVRRYRSTDGYEILIGRTDRDNDNLTLRIAKSLDMWFHAADYPGSHVVLRNPQRKVVPHTSIKEAAELAAKFSQARDDSKVAVNYCARKFVTKPKGFAPGQVRLASFKTILVEPREIIERLY